MENKSAYFQRIAIGGSGSTGSSLLNNILGRHSQVYSGIETSLLSKKKLYENWEANKNKILKRKLLGLKNFSWHRYNGVDLDYSDGTWSKEKVGNLITESNSFQDFLDHYFAKMMRNKENTWIEKTPSNAFSFDTFLNQIDNSKVIHTTRNPYDTIASLYKRGLTLTYSIGVYLLNAAAALSIENQNLMTTVKYESLVLNQESTLNQVCDFLHLPFESEMLQPDKERSLSSPSWKNDEFAAISTSSLNRFEELSKPEQEEIINAVDAFYINSTGKKYFNIKYNSIEEICKILKYEYRKPSMDFNLSSLRKELFNERFNRIRRLYPTGFYFPLAIKTD